MKSKKRHFHDSGAIGYWPRPHIRIFQYNLKSSKIFARTFGAQNLDANLQFEHGLNYIATK